MMSAKDVPRGQVISPPALIETIAERLAARNRAEWPPYVTTPEPELRIVLDGEPILTVANWSRG